MTDLKIGGEEGGSTGANGNLYKKKLLITNNFDVSVLIIYSFNLLSCFLW